MNQKVPTLVSILRTGISEDIFFNFVDMILLFYVTKDCLKYIFQFYAKMPCLIGTVKYQNHNLKKIVVF